jgi:hypothetical protein
MSLEIETNKICSFSPVIHQIMRLDGAVFFQKAGGDAKELGKKLDSAKADDTKVPGKPQSVEAPTGNTQVQLTPGQQPDRPGQSSDGKEAEVSHL